MYSGIIMVRKLGSLEKVAPPAALITLQKKEKRGMAVLGSLDYTHAYQRGHSNYQWLSKEYSAEYDMRLYMTRKGNATQIKLIYST